MIVAVVQILQVAAMLSSLFEIIRKYVLNKATLHRVFKLVLMMFPPVDIIWSLLLF